MEQIETLAADHEYNVLGVDQEFPPETWMLLNESLFARRPDIHLWISGATGDLSFAPVITNVESLAFRGILDSTVIGRLVQMHWLKRLDVSLSSVEDFSFLAELPGGLESLSLGLIHARNRDISAVSKVTGLRTLYLDGHRKGIESITELAQLEDLTLRSITLPSLDILQPMERLRSLSIKLGGTRNLEGLSEMPSIRFLELVQIQKFEDLSPVAKMSGLQNLRLESLPRIQRIPDLSQSKSLRRITLDSMKGLKTLAEVATAPNLEEFAQIAAPPLPPEAYLPVLKHPRLRRMLISGDGRTKRTLVQQMRERGIQPIERLHSENAFVYQ
ncbi:hypothetical protein EON82_16420 [bacterium]|nr:MAG: hypothetical protein EON82_16420 [bacterium]